MTRPSWIRGPAAITCAGAMGWLLMSGVFAQETRPSEQTASRRVRTASPALGGIDIGSVPDTAVLQKIEVMSQQHLREGGYEGGRVLVKFREGASATARTSAAAQARAVAQTNDVPEYADFEVMHLDASADPQAVADALAARADVEYAQPDYRVYPRFRPNDPEYGRQWNLSVLGMEAAWDINRGASSSIIVAVLDTGMAFENTTFTYTARSVRSGNVTYPALGRITVPFAAAPDLTSANRFVAPRDFIWNDSDPVDLDGHGTHVAGTIGQSTDNNSGGAGMAFNVRLMPVKVISTDWDFVFDSPNVGTDSVIAQGIRYAVDNGARVLNMSIGRSGGPAPAVESALRYAVSRGAFVAISAGNDFEDGNPVEIFAELAGQIDGVMSVAAVNRDLNRAPYSGVKPYVEIAAPGGDVRVGGINGLVIQQSYDPNRSLPDPLSRAVQFYGAPRFDIFVQLPNQGTSMAAPHVSGLAALLMQQGITNPVAIEAAIKQFATDRGAAGKDDEFGFGVIAPRNTLRGLGLLK